MKRGGPSPLARLFDRHADIVAPPLVEKFSRSVRPGAPCQGGNGVDDRPELLFRVSDLGRHFGHRACSLVTPFPNRPDRRIWKDAPKGCALNRTQTAGMASARSSRRYLSLYSSAGDPETANAPARCRSAPGEVSDRVQRVEFTRRRWSYAPRSARSMNGGKAMTMRSI